MSVIEIISAIILILACIFIIVIVLMQDSNKGMSQAITGSSGDNYYQKNSSRTKEAKLKRATRTAAICLFVITVLVNVVSIYFSGKEDPYEDLPTLDLGTINVDEDGNAVVTSDTDEIVVEEPEVTEAE